MRPAFYNSASLLSVPLSQFRDRARYEISTAVLLKMQIFRNLTPCRLINCYRHWEGQQCHTFTFDPSKLSEPFWDSSTLQMKAYVFAVMLLRNRPRRFFRQLWNFILGMGHLNVIVSSSHRHKHPLVGLH